MTKLIEVRNNSVSQFIWIVSCISLFMFCVEFANPTKTILGNRIRLTFILALIHLITTSYLVLNLWSLEHGEYLVFYNYSGIILWYVIAFYEAKWWYQSRRSLCITNEV